ncbi:hypothetical protein Tco_0705341 [Tanacetum coccineum]|uniref:Ribosomal protein S13 n=1 Tax=Tanacetum coccineum TaxID=301880 RepID=A0ABQ4Y557_9ASTR
MMSLMTWKLLDPNALQTSLRKIRMRRFGFGLIPRTWPGVLKMLKTGQRARSYADRDPDHLLPSEISRCRAPRLKKEIRRLQALGEYTNDQIMVMVRKGKQRRHIPGVGQVLAGRSKDVLDVPVPRCNHTSDVNELKRNNKLLTKQIDMIMKVMSSDDMMSQLLTQLQS